MSKHTEDIPFTGWKGFTNHWKDDVVAAISGYIDAHNEDPNPIIWSATADKILEKVGRARAALDNLQTG